MVQRLRDGALVHTHLSFFDDREEMSAAVLFTLGTAIDRHRDARGLFVFPDVIELQAKSYEQVIAEVGEGGVWLSFAGGKATKNATAASARNIAQELLRATRSGDRKALAELAREMAAELGGAEPAP